MKRIVLTGLLTGLVMLWVGFLVSFIIHFLWPSLASEYENPQVFRSWSDPAMYYYYAHPFIVGIILAWLWTRTNHLIEKREGWKRGIYFALIYSAVTMTGLLMTYSSFQVGLLMVASWAISNIIQLLCAGLIFAKFLSKSSSSLCKSTPNHIK